MAKVTANGAEIYLKQLQKLGADTDAMCKVAVYEGAGVVADAVRAEIQQIPDQNKPPTAADGGIYAGLYADQKKGLEEGLGVTPITQQDGVWSARVGFDGYNERKTHKYPNGQPNQMIAAATERGTAYRIKTPFIKQAVQKCRKQAEQAMEAALDSEIQKIINK